MDDWDKLVAKARDKMIAEGRSYDHIQSLLLLHYALGLLRGLEAALPEDISSKLTEAIKPLEGLHER